MFSFFLAPILESVMLSSRGPPLISLKVSLADVATSLAAGEEGMAKLFGEEGSEEPAKYGLRTY